MLGEKVSSSEELMKFVRKEFVNLFDQTIEHFFVIAFNEKQEVVGTQMISTGDEINVSFDGRKVVKYLLDLDAKGAVFIHNHPVGSLMASPIDLHTTGQWGSLLATISVTLYDHVVVGPKGSYSVRSGAIEDREGNLQNEKTPELELVELLSNLTNRKAVA